MSHPNQGPEYLAVTSICQHTGETVVLGIFKDLDAVFHRLRGFPTSCGDGYRIECFHLSEAENERTQADEVLERWKRARAEFAEKDKAYTEYLRLRSLDRNKRSEEKAIHEDIKIDRFHADLDRLDDEWET